MNTTRIIFTEKIQRTPSVVSFRFVLEGPFSFVPGQFAKLLFDEQDEHNQTLNKYLSLSCAPGKDYIEFTKRLSDSDFSQRLKALKPGDVLAILGPLGNCTFQDNYQKLAFLIGGIGITPVISMIEYTVDTNISPDILLFYSNKSDEEIAFKPQLDQWQEKHSNIHITYAVTDCQPREKGCITGSIDKQLISNICTVWDDRIVFIFGPPSMVDIMRALSIDVGCKPKSVKTESFVGY